MLVKQFRRLAVGTLAVATLASSHAIVFAQDASDDGKPKKRRVIVIEDDDVNTELSDAGDRAVELNNDRRVIVRKKTPKYWIGVACTMEGEGVSVGEVLPDSPAEKAGLKSGDRILSVDEFAVAELSDLVDAVQTDDTIHMKVQRGDETIEVAVTPANRPRDLDGPRNRWDDIHVDERWEDLMPHLRGLMGDDLEDFDISMIQPGVVIGPAEIPSGVSISVRRDGDGPAKISIKRGDDSWEVTEDSVGELPEDLQGPARKMLSAVGGRTFLNRPGVERKFERILPGIRIAPEGRIRRRSSSDDVNEELRSQLDEMRKEIRELKAMLEELKGE